MQLDQDLRPPDTIDRTELIVRLFGPRREKTGLQGVCEQHRRRPACASAQSDHRLCYLHSGKYHIQTCYKRNFNFVASLCSLGDWFESHFVGNPEDRFCRNKAHFMLSDQLILISQMIRYTLM